MNVLGEKTGEGVRYLKEALTLNNSEPEQVSRQLASELCVCEFLRSACGLCCHWSIASDRAHLCASLRLMPLPHGALASQLYADLAIGYAWAGDDRSSREWEAKAKEAIQRSLGAALSCLLSLTILVPSCFWLPR